MVTITISIQKLAPARPSLLSCRKSMTVPFKANRRSGTSDLLAEQHVDPFTSGRGLASAKLD